MPWWLVLFLAGCFIAAWRLLVWFLGKIEDIDQR
jgi:hypothetical protein